MIKYKGRRLRPCIENALLLLIVLVIGYKMADMALDLLFPPF